MREKPPASEKNRLSKAENNLMERVRSRVTSTQRALSRRDAKSPRETLPSSALLPSMAGTPELRALRVVYGALCKAHRQHRDRTGAKIPQALSAAARAFKHEPSVMTLVPVAGHLDELGLIKW